METNSTVEVLIVVLCTTPPAPARSRTRTHAGLTPSPTRRRTSYGPHLLVNADEDAGGLGRLGEEVPHRLVAKSIAAGGVRSLRQQLQR